MANDTVERRKITEYVKNMNLRDHAVLIYENPQDKRNVLFTYLKAGLDKGEAATYVTSQETPEEIRESMRKFGIDVEKHTKNGSLHVFDYRNWYIIDGKFNIERTVGLWKKLLEESKSQGFKGMRVTGETECFFQNNMIDELFEYEHSLHKTLDIPMTAICAYDSNLLVTRKEWFNLLIELLNTHSTAIMLGKEGVASTSSKDILITIPL